MNILFTIKNIDACYEVIDSLLEIFEKEFRNYFSDSKETIAFSNCLYRSIERGV